MRFLKLIIQSAKLWLNQDMVYYAAAFSYYAPLALAPLILISLTVVGVFYGEEATAKIFSGWGEVLGSDLMKMITIAVNNLTIATNSFTIPIIGILFFSVICLVALNVVSAAFERLRQKEKMDRGLFSWIKRSFRSAIFIFILQFYLMGIITINSFLTLINPPGGEFISLIGFGLSSVVFFTALYRLLYKSHPSLKGCLVGGVVATILFMSAKHAVYVTLITTPALNFYGGAGLILVLLIWVYVLAAILLYGAAIANTYDKIYLSDPIPK